MENQEIMYSFNEVPPQDLEAALMAEKVAETEKFRKAYEATWDFRQRQTFTAENLPLVPGADTVERFRGKDRHGWETNGVVWSRQINDKRYLMRVDGGTRYVKYYPACGLLKVTTMLDAAVGHGKTEKEESGEYVRLRNNIARARSMVEEYGLCNEFTHFATFTISPEKLDRTNLEEFRKRLTQLVRNVRRRKDADIAFLLVPELHRDGKSWHMHGLFRIPETLLTEYAYSPHLPKKIKERLKAGKRVFCWKSAEENYGWNTFEPIENQEKAVRYIMKYLGKDNINTAEKLEKGQHLYYASRNLEVAKKIDAESLGELPASAFERYYETCVVQWYKYTPDSLQCQVKLSKNPEKFLETLELLYQSNG